MWASPLTKKVVRLRIVAALFLGRGGKQQKKRQQQRDGGDGSDEQGIDADGVGSQAHGLGLIIDAMTAHEHAVGIDAVGRAGDERTQVLSLLRSQGLNLAGQDNENAVDLVGEHLVERADDEQIALGELV